MLERGAPGYPEALLDLERPPLRLHVRGRLPAARGVAIVGSRAATDYGLRFASRLAEDLARLGYPIVSGLARGIDAAAHEGALSAGGATVAVLPGGLSLITPRSNAALAERIVERGALITEHDDDVAPYASRFLERNRLIAALARVTVVVEAAVKSGALSTATWARRLGRPVLAVPGDVDRPTSRGCHHLLRLGARVCEGARDVLEALGAETGLDAATPPVPDSTGLSPEARVQAALADRPETVETIAERAAVPLPETLAILLRLEWAGIAAGSAGSRWRRGRGGA